MRDASERCVTSPWLTIEQGAKYLHMRTSTLRAHVRSGEVPSYRRGRVTLVHAQDLDAWVRGLPSGASAVSTSLRLA